MPQGIAGVFRYTDRMSVMRSFFCLLILFTPVLRAASGWNLARDESGISIYTRESPGRVLKQQRGEMVIRSTPAALVALIMDVGACSEWVDRCQQSELLSAPGRWPARVHTIIRLPWPFASRDVVFEADIRRNPESGVTEIAVHDIGGDVAPDSHRVRMPELAGSWRFTPLADDTVRVEYEVRADPGGYLPGWVANMAAVGAAYRTLARMRDLAQKPRYRNAPVRSPGRFPDSLAH